MALTDIPNTRIPTTQDLLSPHKFQIVIDRFPMVNFFAQVVPIPGLSINNAMQFTSTVVDIPVPGDKINFEDITISVILDKDLQSFREIYNWLWECAQSETKPYSDFSVLALNNFYNNNITFKFHNSFPIAMDSFLLDTKMTEDQVLTVNITFKYSHFTIV